MPQRTEWTTIEYTATIRDEKTGRWLPTKEKAEVPFVDGRSGVGRTGLEPVTDGL